MLILLLFSMVAVNKDISGVKTIRYLLSPDMEVVRCFGVEYNAEQLSEAIWKELNKKPSWCFSAEILCLNSLLFQGPAFFSCCITRVWFSIFKGRDFQFKVMYILSRNYLLSGNLSCQLDYFTWTIISSLLTYLC